LFQKPKIAAAHIQLSLHFTRDDLNTSGDKKILHIFLLNICVPSQALPSNKIFLGAVTGFEALCGSGAAKPNHSRREN